MNSYFMQNSQGSTPSVLAELQREIFGITDREPYQVDGHVVAQPQGYEYPHPVYGFQPLFAPGAGEEFRLMLLGVFFLLALAIILRR